jgi:hypothetical protein
MGHPKQATATAKAIIHETFEPTWPGQPAQWVCVVRVHRADGCPVVFTSEGSADDLGRRRARKLARQWCEANGFGPGAEVRPGAQSHAPVSRFVRQYRKRVGAAAQAEVENIARAAGVRS